MPHDFPRPARCVSARHLSRNIAPILDEIDRTGWSLLVTRRGVPAAMLVPAPENIFAGVPDPGMPPVGSEEIAGLELTDEQKQLLILMSDGGSRSRPWEELDLDSRSASLYMMRMELSGLIARPRGLYRITKYGLDVLRSLELAGDEVL